MLTAKSLVIGNNYTSERRSLWTKICDFFNGTRRRTLKLLDAHNDALLAQKFASRMYHIPNEWNVALVHPNEITRDNVLKWMNWLALDEGNDVAFLHISGHGVYENGFRPENDRRVHDSLPQRGFLTSDKKLISKRQFQSFAKSISPTTKLVSVFDFCYSGNIFDLEYVDGRRMRSGGLSYPCQIVSLSSSTHLEPSIDTGSMSSRMYSRCLQTASTLSHRYISQAMVVPAYHFSQQPQIFSSYRIRSRESLF